MKRYTVRQGLDRGVMTDFLRLPKAIYGNDPLWVPPITSDVRRTLNTAKNPYFSFATQERFVCYKDGAAVARMIVILDPKQRDAAGTKTALFGYFDSINDRDAARHLLIAAERYARSLGATHLEGPFNPNYYSELGIKMDTFDCAPHFFETYNPEYYPALLCEAGYSIAKRLKTYRLPRWSAVIQRRFGEGAPTPVQPPYTVRSLRMNDLARDLEQIREVYNDAFAANPYFHDVSQAEYAFSAKYLRYVTEPELTTIVEVDGKAVAVTQLMQEVNPLLRIMNGKTGPLRFLRYQRDRKLVRSAVFYAIGIKKQYQRSYVMGLLLRRNVEIFRNFDEVTTTWVSDDDTFMLNYTNRLGFVPDRSFALFKKELGHHE